MGSLLALKAMPPIKMRLVRELPAAAGIALILYADFLFANETPFPGPSAFIPCFGAWLIIYAREQGSSWASATLFKYDPAAMAMRVLVAIARTAEAGRQDLLPKKCTQAPRSGKPTAVQIELYIGRQTLMSEQREVYLPSSFAISCIIESAASRL